MACRDCQKGKKKYGICEVHQLVDGDTRERLTRWCPICDAFICDQCRDNLPKRAQAAAIRAASRVANRIRRILP